MIETVQPANNLQGCFGGFFSGIVVKVRKYIGYFICFVFFGQEIAISNGLQYDVNVSWLCIGSVDNFLRHSIPFVKLNVELS